MNPLPGDQGDTYLAPMNMVPADRLSDFADAQIEAAKTKQSLAPANPGAGPGSTAPTRAAQAVVEEAVSKIVRLHGNAARRAASSAERLRLWTHEYFTAEREIFRSTDMLRSAVALLGLEDPGGAARRVAEQLAQEAKQDLIALIAKAPPQLRDATDALVHSWLNHRVRQASDQLAALSQQGTQG